MMVEKVTGEYEKEGHAIYYVTLPPEEHALILYDMRDKDDISIRGVTVQTLEGEIKGIHDGLKELFTKYPHKVYFAIFDIVYYDLTVRVELDFQKKNVHVLVDPMINKEQKRHLLAFFNELMDCEVVIETPEDDYSRLERKIKVVALLGAGLLSAVLPVIGGILFVAVLILIQREQLSRPIIDKIYEKRGK